MTRADPHYRCPACTWECLSVEFDRCGEAISSCCDEICEKYWLCLECNTRPMHCGYEQCLECITDHFIEKPQDFADDHQLKAEIADELAKRLRPFLARRQAA